MHEQKLKCTNDKKTTHQTKTQMYYCSKKTDLPSSNNLQLTCKCMFCMFVFHVFIFIVLVYLNIYNAKVEGGARR